MRYLNCPTCNVEADYVTYSTFSYLYCKQCKTEIGADTNPEQSFLYYRNWFYNDYDKRWLYPYSQNSVRYRTDEAIAIQRTMDKGWTFDEAVKKTVG